MPLLEYVASQSTARPELIEVTPFGAYLRKNIVESVDDSGDVTVTFYNYEETYMTIDQFNAYANQLLMNGQEDSTNNQLAIMEAFADLYETMLMNV